MQPRHMQCCLACCQVYHASHIFGMGSLTDAAITAIVPLDDVDMLPVWLAGLCLPQVTSQAACP